jgi:hypothetical protein
VPTKRTRSLYVSVLEGEDGSPPAPIAHIDRALKAWGPRLPGLRKESLAFHGEPGWTLKAEGKFAAGEVRRLAILLQKAVLPGDGHVVILLYEQRREEEVRILRAEIFGYDEIEFEFGPEE